MLQSIVCRGTPYEIGWQHGEVAKAQIERCIAFYAKLFLRYSNQQWPQVLETASMFEKKISISWLRYHEEMRGIADSSRRDLLDIIAINVRTEIAFGLFTDGCTSLSWRTQTRSLLGQNWDWMEEQKENLVAVTIHQQGLPTIKMVTEAGMIGKIGFNSCGVGVCFNAIRAKGLDASRLPVHLGLRMALESSCAAKAAENLERIGMASSAHMLVADPSGSVGLEFTSTTFARLEMDSHRRVIHSNHMLLHHEGLCEPPWLLDSPARVDRMKTLTGNLEARSVEPSWKEFSRLFEDEDGFPSAICRKQSGDFESETLFNIVMDLVEKRAVVRIGRPCEVEETLDFSFHDEKT